MLKIKDLEFSYDNGEFGLNVSELSIAKNQKVAIIGPSGSGKTTFLNLLGGILKPRKGKITVGQTIVNEMPDRERRAFRIRTIGFVFQDFELLEYLTVQDNILHPYRISDAQQLTKEIKERARQLAAEMNIEDKLSRYPETLSQGEKQRVAICRALLPEPKLIFADEATGNLDPTNKTRILDLLCRAVDQREAALLAVTHDHELLPSFDRVINFADLHSRG